MQGSSVSRAEIQSPIDWITMAGKKTQLLTELYVLLSPMTSYRVDSEQDLLRVFDKQILIPLQPP